MLSIIDCSFISFPFLHLCIIEAMKVLNEVTAEADGEVLEICVADGDLVEFGSCLMRIG